MSFRFALFAAFVQLLPTAALAHWTPNGVPKRLSARSRSSIVITLRLLGASRS